MLRLNTNNLLRSKFAGLSSISLLIICLLLLSVPAAGQTTGRVQGTVTDQQNAVMADATVELLHPATNTTKTTKTTDAGSYGFDYLQPGEYVVKVGIQGFKTASVANVLVEATRTATVNVTLEIGAASETVDVKAGGQRVDTVNAQIATTVEQRFLRDLPSFNRNVLSYAEMQPGVSVNTSGVAGGSQMLDSPGTSANVNGNRSMRNNFYLDGVESANWRNSALQMPNPDAVQEVQVSTSNTAAEYGRQVGGVFNVIPKSGTNQFRGTAFYFFRLKDLNARPWGTPANSKKLAQNQKLFGGNLGGPVFKDKTFFFFSYDGFRDRTARVLNKVNYPTAAMAKGDFSALLAGPNPRIINNPATGQPFPGNIIPAAAQDPVGKSLFNLMQPTVPNFGDLYVWTFEEPARNQTFLAKGDHHWTSAHTTSFTWMRSNGSQTLPAAPGLATTFSAWGPEINFSHQNLYQGRHNWVINPNLIADFHMGFVGHVSDRNNSNFKNAFPDAKGDVMTTLGARNVTDVQEGIKQYLPYLILAGVGIAHHGWIGLVDQPTFQFGGKVSWIKSSHTVKFGADAVDKGQRLAVDGSLPATNQLDFDGRFSSNGTTTNVAAYTYADLLLGRATFFQSQGILDYTLKSRDIFFFLQDEWKITPRLTLSPGLRYELYLPPRVNGDQRTGYFTPNPVQGAISTHRSTRFPNAPAGLAFEGDRGVPSGFFENQRNLIAPRFGVAWDVFGDSRTALRAGVGKYYGSTPLQTKAWSSEQNPWQPATACLGPTIASNPWLGCTANKFTAPPTPFSSATVENFVWPNPVPQIYGFDPKFRTAYSYQWNVSLEREMTKALTVQVAYVGNSGRDQTAIENINFGTFTPAATLSNVQSRRPNQGYGRIFIARSRGESKYNALQTTTTVRLGERLLGRVIYSYQRGSTNCNDDPTGLTGECFANPLNIAGEWGETQRHHDFRAFYTYNLPILNGNNWYSRLLGGWQVSGDVVASSGSPINVIVGSDWNYDGIGGDRPDRAGSIQYPRQDLGNRSWQWLSPSGFQQPGGGTNRNTFGNLPRNAVFGPGFWGANAALLKNFRIESRSAQFRFEAFNVFNHSNLGIPNLNLADPNFGRSFGKSGNRLVQLGLKFYF